MLLISVVSPTTTVAPPSGNVYVIPSTTNLSDVCWKPIIEAASVMLVPTTVPVEPPTSIVTSSESSPVKLVDKPMFIW